MESFNPWMLLSAGLAIALVAFVGWYVKKHGVPKSAAEVQTNLRADAPALEQMVGGLYAKVAHEFETIRGDLAAMRSVSNTLQPRYIDRDDFFKAIGATAFAYAITLDGKLVHNGQAPTVAYTTQPDGSVAIVAAP